MAFKYTGKTPDTFLEATRNYGFLATCRTRLRDVILLIRRLYLVKVWKMDIHPFTIISLKATLDRTYPRGVHIGEGSAVNFGAVILTHDMARSQYMHTRIGKYSAVGARSIIMPSVTGRRSFHRHPRRARQCNRCGQSRQNNPHRHHDEKLRPHDRTRHPR